MDINTLFKVESNQSVFLEITNNKEDISSFFKNATINSDSTAVVVTNSSLKELCYKRIEAKLQEVFNTVHLIEVPDGEVEKNLDRVSMLLDVILDINLERRDYIIALGGGVIGDLVGFVASIYKRGVGLIHLPTTLLAQVDSSIGGKTGVNHSVGKNLIGTFYQPNCILSDISFLDTLPKREWLCGMAEIVKYGVIGNISLFEYIEGHLDDIIEFDVNKSPEIWLKLISESSQQKVNVVQKDEKEAGLREILNFGHTFAHAIETHFEYGIYLHGEAVAIGMLMAGYLGVLIGDFSLDDLTRLERLIARLGFEIYLKDVNETQLFNLLKHDKKVKSGKIRFVLPLSIGEVVVKEVEDDSLVLKAISKYINK